MNVRITDQMVEAGLAASPDFYRLSERDRCAVIEAALTASDEAGTRREDVETEDTSEPDIYLRAVLNYTAGFYATAIKHGVPSGTAADAVQHVERAARHLHRLAAAPTPPGTEAVGGTLDMILAWYETLPPAAKQRLSLANLHSLARTINGRAKS